MFGDLGPRLTRHTTDQFVGISQEELLQEKSKHQRYVNKKTEEMRALMQEVCRLTLFRLLSELVK